MITIKTQIKTALFAAFALLLLAACKKTKCVSCIAESQSGVVMKHTIECDPDTDYLDGYEDGLRQYYRDHGDTVTVTCIYGK